MGNLIVRDLHVERNGRPVLNGCSADFPGKHRTVLWGRSGAGKSTLLAAVAGLLAPAGGSITLGSQILFSADERIEVPPHQRRIGYVFPDLALWPHLTALQQVRLVGRASALDAAGAYAVLESVGLASLASRRPAELSGGEQQRLAIARAVAGNPMILLFDEPFSSLDRETRRSVHDLLHAISPTVAGPTIYVTHNAEDAQSLAERAFRLRDGLLVADDRAWNDRSSL